MPLRWQRLQLAVEGRALTQTWPPGALSLSSLSNEKTSEVASHGDGCGGAEAAQGFAGARAHAVRGRALRRLLPPRRLRRQQVCTPSAPKSSRRPPSQIEIEVPRSPPVPRPAAFACLPQSSPEAMLVCFKVSGSGGNWSTFVCLLQVLGCS